MEVFNIYNIYIGLQNFIYKIDLKVFQWAPIDVWPLTTDVDCPVLWFPLLYLHGLNTVLSFTLSGNMTSIKSHHTSIQMHITHNIYRFLSFLIYIYFS